MKREIITLALNHLDDRHIRDASVFSPEGMQASPERIVHMNRKRILSLALAAALILALGATVYAISGSFRFTVTQDMPENGTYTRYEDLSTVEKSVGFPITAPERFTNGYAFSQYRVIGLADYGENNDMLKKYYEALVDYAGPGAEKLTLVVSPASDMEGTAHNPSRRNQIKGIEVIFYMDHYKFVPEDYEITPEDLAAEATGRFFISFGSDSIREQDIASAVFSLDGVGYTLMEQDCEADALGELSQMAGELIAMYKS